MSRTNYLLLTLALLTPLVGVARDVCNICLDTPSETNELYSGKGGNIDGQSRTEKLAKPMFSGNLYYSLDDGEKVALPASKGLFFQIQDRKKHKLKILSESDRNWGTIRFDCSEYKYGTKVFFENGSTYGPGWRTYPMPKNEKKCRWHPEYK